MLIFNYSLKKSLLCGKLFFYGLLFLYECQALGATAVVGGNRDAVGDTFLCAIEQAGRVAFYRRIYREVGLREFRRAFGIEIEFVVGGFVSGAGSAARHAHVTRTAAVAVVVLAIFLSAFEIVHLLTLLLCLYR